MANFVSNDNATSLINAINSKKDTKPVEITYAEWIVLTDEERAGTHYLITDVPAQSGGGHVIENTAGTDMPQEDNLQFVGVYSEDDSTNNRTKVNIVRDMTKAQMDALSSAEKEGFIHVTDEPDNPYNGESGGGGHTIVDPSGESMTQQPNMQFADAHVTNDSTNSSTNIEILSSISESDFDDLDETDTDNEGLYEIESNSDIILTDDMVAHDATHTVREAINALSTYEEFHLDKFDNADSVENEKCFRIGRLVVINARIRFSTAKTGSPVNIAKIPTEYAPTSSNTPIYACDDTNDKPGNGLIFYNSGDSTYRIAMFRPQADTSVAATLVNVNCVYIQ